CPRSTRFDMTPPDGQGLIIEVDRLFAWSTNGDYVINEGFTGFDYSPPNDVRRLRGNLSKVRSPCSTVFLADGQPRPREPDDSFPTFPHGWVTWTPLDTKGSVTLADAWLDRTRANNRTGSKDNFDPFRHRGRINVLFLDGHVESLLLNERDLS